MRVRPTLVVAVIALSATACSAEVSIGGGLDIEALETAIVETGDEQRADLAPFTADCADAPDELETGDTFTCTATDAEGTEYPVTVTATDDEGNVDFAF